MANQYTTITTNKKVTRKLSVAVGLLSFFAFVIQGMSTTWGFETVGQQITQTALLFSGAINIFFLGSSTQKSLEENKTKTENTDGNKENK